MPIQQMLLGVGAKKKTYMDDVFSNYLYLGNQTDRSFNNGIDLSGEGGLVWIKHRDGTYSNNFFDTERGATKSIYSNLDIAEEVNSSTLTSFNSNGFSIGTHGSLNATGNSFASWSFRKAPGFFTCLTYTGNNDGSNANRTISHDLGSIPGCIIVKRTDANNKNWYVYHRNNYTLANGPSDPAANPAGQWLFLDQDNATFESNNSWGGVQPTSTNFTVGWGLNNSGADFIAYLFAGGESTAATARSVYFDGSDDNTVWQGLSGANADDLTFGTGDFTVEGWVNPETMVGTTPTICDFRDQTADSSTTSGFWLGGTNDGKLRMYSGGAFLDNPSEKRLFSGQWSHFAVVRSSGTIKIFINGIQYGSDVSNSTDFNNSNNRKMRIGAGYTGNDLWNGKVSNFRVTKGQALYTTAFKPSTEPLTTTSQGATASNVKLLCCNNSSTTGSTVTPVTPANNGSPTASTDSPFDDPAGFVFGDAGDQNVIKTGSYFGNGSSTGPKINLGWEPQWLLIKDATSSGDGWEMFDSMRGIVSNGSDQVLNANENYDESSGGYLDLTPTGFKFTTSSTRVNKSGDNYIYMAIRRPDGYVGKPPELGTDVFAMVYGNSSGTNPSYVSNFPVDFALSRQPASSEAWYAAARLIQTKYLRTNGTNAEADATSNFLFDHNNGWRDGSAITNYLSWMWKRHAGFDVVSYTGSNSSHNDVPHNLGKIPEMLWIKARDRTAVWVVYHKGLNGGTNPHTYNLQLNHNGAEGAWNWSDSTPPSSTHFTVSSGASINFDENYLALLFASVDGISKVGYYDGWNWPSTNTIECGFQPRFVVIKKVTGTGGNPRDWHVFDTVRGIAGSNGNDALMEFNNTNASSTHSNYLELTSSGFSPKDGDIHSSSSDRFIFYAHA